MARRPGRERSASDEHPCALSLSKGSRQPAHRASGAGERTRRTGSHWGSPRHRGRDAVRRRPGPTRRPRCRRRSSRSPARSTPPANLHRARPRGGGVEGRDHRLLGRPQGEQRDARSDGFVDVQQVEPTGPQPAAYPGGAQRSEVHPGHRSVVADRTAAPAVVNRSLVDAEPSRV